ncbi:hypothetical protein MMC32_002069 [Xylographa parallela]|nr:hypothetical protein [Xylographa parallela]
MDFATSRKKAAKERWDSALYGQYYLYANVEEGQVMRVEVQCKRCNSHKLNDNDATYETGTESLPALDFHDSVTTIDIDIGKQSTMLSFKNVLQSMSGLLLTRTA